MTFKNRKEAGKRLAAALKHYANEKALVVALPRGGVVVGYEIAQALNLPLDIVCPRKLGAPENLEYAIGVVTEEGEVIRTKSHPADLEPIAKKERAIAKKRVEEYRQGLPPRSFENKIVILVDDGLATGATMLGAIKSVEKAKKVVLAVPVAAPDSLNKFEKLVDEIVCLESPQPFYAVAQFYDSFDQVTDSKVKKLIALSRSRCP